MQIFSEIGTLKEVLVHTPGLEVDLITPDSAKQLLFEDIIYGDLARKEHHQMCQIFKKFGVKVHFIKNLLSSSLKNTSSRDKENFLTKIKESENLKNLVFDSLMEANASNLASFLIEGIPDKSAENDYLLHPVPNLLFARDPILVIGNQVISASMKEVVRKREALILSFIFTFHPVLKCNPLYLDEGLNIEGGDCLVLDKNTIFIGESLRTSRETILKLIPILKNLQIKNLIIKKLPLKIPFIHLDTTFTRINHHECLLYPPLYMNKNDDLTFIDLENNKQKSFDYIFDLFKYINIELEPIFCGGVDNLIMAKREQWGQGANAFNLAPGIIIIYSRNILTINELAKKDYFCISAKEFLKKSFTNIPENAKMAILISGGELSRARGGPRCLTHPIIRQEVT